MSIHDGHRKRLIKRAMDEGLDGFSQHNVLELLLFFAIPRRDTNEIAHALIKRFGSLSGVFDAPMAELLNIDGIGENSAALIKLIPQLSRQYLTDRDNDICLRSTEKAGNYLLSRYIGRREETVMLVSMDSKYRVLGTTVLHTGSINSTEVNIRKVVATALQYDAVNVIIAHNHPGGIALPSHEDIATTQRVKDALAAINVKLVDHIIIADNDFVSLADSGNIR